jgi:hypothetical protein
MQDEDILLVLAEFKEDIVKFTDPEVLKKFLDFREALGGDRDSFVTQYKVWLQKNGPDCRYAAMCKNFFLKEQAEKVAQAINWLFYNWSRFYENK